MEALLRSIRYTLRVLARAPGFTATVVLTLALGIGATSAMYSVIDTVLLRPLPYPDAERLVVLTQIREGAADTSIAPPRLEDWNRLSSGFEAISGYYVEDVSDTTGDLPERVRRATVAPRFLEVMGIAPVLGRGFADEEQRAGGAVLISHRYWRRRFGADPEVLGKVLELGQRSARIVGVMPETFRFPDREVDLWSPMAVDPNVIIRTATWFTGLGRLKPGTTLEQAQADLTTVQSRLAQQFPDTDRDIRVIVRPLKESTVAGVRGSLWLLFAAVFVLLLIACTNIAALLLARAAQRQQELALRFSLGASGGKVALQVLTEAAVLTLAGAVLGLLVAWLAPAAIQAAAPELPRLEEFVIDARILAFTIVLAVIVILLCGVFPAIRCTRVLHALQGSGRSQISAGYSLQWLLVGVQVALSVTLLTGAGLLLRSFDKLSSVDPGFDATRVLTFNMSGGWYETQQPDRVLQRIDRTLDELSTLPGIEAAATAVALPGIPGERQGEFELIEGVANSRLRPVAAIQTVSPSYFEVLQIPLLSGELCRRRARPPASDESLDVMVNRQFVDRYLGGRSAVGLHLRDALASSASRIVGVVGDAR